MDRYFIRKLWLGTALWMFLAAVKAGQAPVDTDSWAASFHAARALIDRGEFHQTRDILASLIKGADAFHPDPLTLIETLNELGFAQYSTGSFSQAETTYRRAIQLTERHPQKLNLILSKILDNFASVYADVGRLGEAESLRQRALKLSLPVLGQDHPQIGTQLSNLGTV